MGLLCGVAVLELGGELRLGPGDWEAQGLVAPHAARVAAFRLDAHEVTERAWSTCVAAGACPTRATRGEPGAPVTDVTADEAAAFCTFRGGALPTSDQLAFAAAGAASRRYPWGETGAVCRRAAWGLAHGPCGEAGVGPDVAGSHPGDVTPDGVLDLAGNVAEWTRPEAKAAQDADVLGGSWADAEAAALRTWRRRPLPRGTRSPEIGFRCAFAGTDSPGSPQTLKSAGP
ncbi:MAG TPA: SUMF1/EgtB/PvdO family nonheme iron enzyme [Minicystis sp.]|nr:SUMF1/EgtB/PvdO family nonheme iron enzyme [Minicystis sp.]